jgi:hypothetical protein
LSCPAHRDYKKIEWAGKVQANERDKLKLANAGQFELYPDVNQENVFFHLFPTIQVFDPGFINNPNCFTIILRRKFRNSSLVGVDLLS